MYTYIDIHIYIYIYVYIYIYKCEYNTHPILPVSMNKYMLINKIHTYKYIHIQDHIHTFVHISDHIYIYTSIGLSSLLTHETTSCLEYMPGKSSLTVRIVVLFHCKSTPREWTVYIFMYSYISEVCIYTLTYLCTYIYIYIYLYIYIHV
jgi:hypothetical protein